MTWEPHATCHHYTYGLSCNEFDARHAEAAGRCQLCGRPSVRLWIDHDHSVFPNPRGVRGLVCPKCNAHLRRVDAGEREIDATTSRYLVTPWHTRLPNGRIRQLPCSDELWLAARAKASSAGQTPTDAIIGFLREYIAPEKPPAE